MKFADCLLDNFDDVSKHTQDGIEFSRELANFIKKKQAVEEDYSKSLQKLCKSFESSKKTTAHQGRLYESCMTMVSEIEHSATLHKQLAIQMEKLLVDTFQNHIREAEATRKNLVAEGLKARADLQDSYIALKKAKDNRDKLLKEAVEAEETLAKTLKASKDVSKLMTKAQLAREKAKASEIQVDQCSIIAEESQETYYKHIMPKLMDKFQAFESARITFTKDGMGTFNLLESRLPAKIKAGCDRITMILEDITVDEEIRTFISDHISDSRYTNVSVASLQGATMKGRLMRAANNNTWRSRYLVLMGQLGLLYIFESEDSLKPQDVLNLRNSFIRPVHDSLFSKKHCFHIISISEPLTFSAEDEWELHEWLKMLKAVALNLSPSDYSSLPRRITYMTVSVIEGKHLPVVDPLRRSANPYCTVSLDTTKQATTQTVYNTTMPLWNEKILIDDLPPFESCRVKVFSESTFPMKDVELGFLDLPKNLLESGQVQDQWLPLLPSSSLSTNHGFLMFSEVDEDAVSKMAIRVKAEYKSEMVLPLMDYKEMVKMVLNEDLVAARILFDTTEDRDRITQLLVRIWYAMHCALNNLRKLISTEIDSTDDPQIIFRGNSLATKATEQYMRSVCTEYVQQVLAGPIKQVLTSKYSCEIDDTRIMEGEDIQRNVKRLLGHVKTFLDAIFGSTEQSPNELRYLIHTIQEKVTERFKNDHKVRYTAVSGFVFLRFFCPAIVSPRSFGIATDNPDERSLRTLKLIAKILQTLANVVEDGPSKESFMAEISSFIQENIPPMKAFIDEISSTPKSVVVSKKGVIDIAREMEAIKSYYLAVKDKISQQAEYHHPSVEQLYVEIAKLSERAKEVGSKLAEEESRTKKE